jgi:hypothetical protein
VIGGAGVALPRRCRFHQAEDDETEPKIDRQTNVSLEGSMSSGGRKVGHQKKVNSIPHNYRNQGLHEIIHCRFRHRIRL